MSCFSTLRSQLVGYTGRAFVYDYSKKQIVCYGVCTFPGELSGQDRNAKMLIAGVPELAPIAGR